MSARGNKLRKLRRDPAAFVRDAVRIRAARLDDEIRRMRCRLPMRRQVATRRRYSVVSAVYNVAPYLERYFESFATQTLAASAIELILVDDGSTDDSAAIIERWRARYPGTIRYVRQENAGQAAARNRGLELASGDWVTFIDPDDFVSRSYFEAVDRFLDRHADDDVATVCCNWLVYHERGRKLENSHPLRFRFDNGSFAGRIDESDAVLASGVATSFFRADVLAETSLRFDARIAPNFEDGHFCGRFVLRARDCAVGFVADARYSYRKRAAGTSTLDTGWEHPGRFDQALEYGHLALLREARERAGHVPRALQRLVLYDLFWYFERIVDNEGAVSFLTEAQRARFLERLDRVFEYIDPDTIRDFELAGCSQAFRIGMMAAFKGRSRACGSALLRSFDPHRRLLQVSYAHGGDPPREVLRAGDRVVDPQSAKTQHHAFLGRPFGCERRLWVAVDGETTPVSIELDGRMAGDPVSGRAIVEARRRSSSGLGVEGWLTRRLASVPAVRERFRDAWVLIDRDTQADDNAEHLYRYLQRAHPEINACFVLRRDSYDWDRLRDDGFALVEYGSLTHRCALLNARHVLSSHPDGFAFPHVPNAWYGEEPPRFTFLQHGVIRDDISRWLNRKAIDLMVTSSPAEHASVAGDGNYRFGELETALVGLARHDALLERPEATEKLVVIMPTWREYLVERERAATTRWRPSDAFATSSYLREWRSLLSSVRLRDAAQARGFRLAFFPHANLQSFVEAFEPASWIEVMTHASEPVLQRLFRRAAVLVTDYSSVFFEFGLQRKPVLYYQFDREEMYSGRHPSRAGYFDFDRDGFGPVCGAQGQLVDALTEVLERGAEVDALYLERMERALPFRDGHNRRRTVAAVRALDVPIDGRTGVR